MTMKIYIPNPLRVYLNAVWDHNPPDFRVSIERQYYMTLDRAKFLGINLKDLEIVDIQQRIYNLHVRLSGDPAAIYSLDLHLLNRQQEIKSLSPYCLVLEDVSGTFQV
jgi:hypothetical protein